MINKVKEKWSIPSKSDDELKKISKDLYNGLIFTDRQCGKDVANVFMVIMFMGPKPPNSPKHPNDKYSIENNRDNLIYDILQRDIDQKKYEEDLKFYALEEKYYSEEYIKTIGLIYEYMSEAGPMSVNGKPIFMSLRLLNKEDTEKMINFYNQYKEIREKTDNF